MSSKFALKIKAYVICLALILLILGVSPGQLNAQAQAEKKVAIITDEAGRTRVIRYADLLLQLALEPDAPLEPVASRDLKRALQTLIDRSLIGLELEQVRLSCLFATGEETDQTIRKLSQFFRSPAELEKRLRLAGFQSLQDDRFQREMGYRATLEKWLDLRFRSFMILTHAEEEKYYRDIYIPQFRKRQPGLVIPELQQVRPQIRQILMEQKVEAEISEFLEFARGRVRIGIMAEELK